MILKLTKSVGKIVLLTVKEEVVLKIYLIYFRNLIKTQFDINSKAKFKQSTRRKIERNPRKHYEKKYRTKCQVQHCLA